MGDRVWMQVSSNCYQGIDDQKIRVEYSDAIDMIAIDVGSGHMYVPLSLAMGMAQDLARAVEKAMDAPVPGIRPEGKANRSNRSRRSRSARRRAAAQKAKAVD